MFDHVGIHAKDVEAAVAFYTGAFGPLGLAEAQRIEPPGGGLVVGLAGPDGFPFFWLSTETVPGVRETHIAFRAPDRATVDAVHAAAVAIGAEVLHAPQEWPIYHEGYYGVFLRDLDGNNVEAVCHH